MASRRSYIEDMSESTAAAPLVTAEELLHMYLPDKRVELVRGRLMVREPAGFDHGVVAARLAKRLAIHVDERGLGVVVAAETGFKLFSKPDTVRAPDAAFISTARMPPPGTRGFPPLAPDLVAEVLSPDDRAGEVLSKVGDWLSAGAKLVWVIDPRRGEAAVYRSMTDAQRLQSTDSLDGEDLLPGFRCGLEEILK